jgi:phosphatidylserine/phosphatidylglycerophosphate/cardiolipin synthase-like enzyme
MNYRRVLLITELEGDLRPAISAIRRVTTEADLLVVVACMTASSPEWFLSEAPDDHTDVAEASAKALRTAVAGVASTVDVKITPALDIDELAELVAGSAIDLVAVGPLPLSAVRVIGQLRRRQSVPVLWTNSASPQDRPFGEIACVALGSHARRAVATFLRDHGHHGLHVTLFLPESGAPRDLASTLDVVGILSHVDLVTMSISSGHTWIDHATRNRDIDLLVLAHFPGPLLPTLSWPAPVLVLPPIAATPLRRTIDVADAIYEGNSVRVRFDYAIGIGRREPIQDQAVAFVSSGKITAIVTTENSIAEVPLGLQTDTFGVYRVANQDAADPVTAIEQEVTVIRPHTQPLLLFDADLPAEDLSLLKRHGDSDGYELLAVRLRPMQTCAAIRIGLSASGLWPQVIDASAVLDEGVALDVPEAADPVRLARVGSRMRAAGFPIAGIVFRGPHTPRTFGFASLRVGEIAAAQLRFEPPAEDTQTLATRLDATTGAPLLAGNRVEIELDNALARRWLLEGLAGARMRVHFQVYMALDDDVGDQVEAALAAAGARGVNVRVVVDSLHGLHGSFGAHNRLLARLAARPGVELRVLQPIAKVPSVEDIKQRDHRKLVVIDGNQALVGGRNLSHEYYTGFDEVKLTPQSLWRQVPWLDAGARVMGPAVAQLEHSFLDAWTLAGGSPFEISVPPPEGGSSVRVVVHHGLRDASTLDAYLALIDTAKSHVYAVNGFPLLLEIQHALLRAIRRGVLVRTLFGNLCPTHDGKIFHGPWSTARAAATELVHSRMDALIAAGGEGYQLAVPEQPGWEPGLGVIRPHVHAKVLSVDGRICSVGSANLDITAGYWENELVLLVDDAAVAGALERRIDALFLQSERVDRNNPAWKQTARRRQWMRRWPGMLSV